MPSFCAMAKTYPPIGPFSVAFAAEYKGFMKSAGITGAQIAEQLGRNEGYVSERVNGKRPLDTDDVDVLAALEGTISGRDLMLELARRARSSDHPRGELVEGRFGVGTPTEDDMSRVAVDTLSLIHI